MGRTMGNNSDSRDNDIEDGSGSRQQVNRGLNKNHPRPRGLMPSDGQDAYRSLRVSKRSRNDRLSYLVATGHMDLEETEQLHKPPVADLITTVPSLYSDSPPSTPQKVTPNRHQNQLSDHSSQKPTPTSGLNISTKRSNFDQSFLDNLNHTLANSPVASNNLLQQQQQHQHNHNDSQAQEYTFGGTSFSLKKGGSGSKKKAKKQKSSPYASGNRSGASNSAHRIGNIYTNQTQSDQNNDRKFRQTFTEVTLPMKTSPAFEYILRDNERRNKRCCLWFLYSTLVTICIAIILFCSVHLLLRSHSRN